MRTLLAGELAQAQNYASDYYIKLDVQNGSGTYIDVGAALGTHWIINGSWGESRDTPVSQATFTLLQRIGAASLAPLMTSSALNVDDTLAYSPLLQIGRLMRAWTATMPPGIPPSTSRTNSAKWSRDFSQAPWPRSGAGSSLLNAVGFDGLANTASTVADTDATARTQWTQTLTGGVPVNTATHTVSFWIRKDSDVSRFPLVFAQITGGTSVARATAVNTSTGAIVSNNAIGTTTQRMIDGATIAPQYAAYWIVEITVTNNGTAGNTVFLCGFAPAYGNVINIQNVATTGSMVLGNIQIELNASAFSLPIITTTAPVTVNDYKPSFVGRIDDVAGQDSIYNYGPIILTCSDSGAWLMDLQIEVEGKEYGDPTTPPALETVLQQVINDNIPAGEPAVTLVKESSSLFGVTGWKQGETKLMESLTTLVLDSTGEDIRYRFDASHVSQLMWFDPARDRVTVDATFTQYIIRQLDVAIRDIRNAGEMAYTDSVTLSSGVVTATDPASIANYRRRFIRVPPSTMLTTKPESQAVIDAVVNDLSGPPAEASVELPFCWFVQLYDRYTFAAPSQQYDTDQTFAVGGYQHSIESGRGSTTLTPCTARIVGAYAAWQKRLKGPASDADRSLKDFRVFDEDDTTITYKWVPGPYVLEVWLGVVQFTNPIPADPWAIVTGAAPATGGAIVLLPMSPLADGTVSYTFTKPKEGSVLFAQFEPRDANLSPGPVQRLVVNAAPTQPPIIELDDLETSTVGTQWWKITERGVAVTSVQVQTQVGVEPISAFVDPTRSAGAASAVRGGLLGAGEYEHDVPLDPTRLSWIMPRVTLENGAPPIVLGPFGFDRDKNPNILKVDLTSSTIVSVLADTDTKSIRIFDSLGTWEYVLDGLSATVDVSKVGTNGVAGLGSTATSTFTIQARSDPTAYVDVNTLIVSQNLVISGSGATPPAATWDSPGLTAQAPAVGSGTMTIHLKATSAPVGWTVKLWAGPNNNPSVDITAAVSPALSAPPTVDTTYSYATGIPAVSAPPRTVVVFAVRADLVNNLGAVVDTRLVHPTWYKTP